MAEIITTLHPDGDENTILYPNIKKENIPSKSISTDKLDDNVLSLIGSLKPSGTDISTNILAFTSNKGIYVATDEGHWYYWNGVQYVDGGVYQATEIADGSITTEMLNNDCLAKFPYLNNVDLNDVLDLGRYVCIGCSNTPTSTPYLLEVKRFRSASNYGLWVVQLARKLVDDDYVLYYRINNGSWSKWYSVLDNKNTFEDINYIDNSKIIDGKFINWNNGNIVDSEEYRCYEEYIPVIMGGHYYVAFFNQNGGLNIDYNYALLGAYYDENKSYLGEIYVSGYDNCRGGSLENNKVYLTLPNNCKYVRLSFKDKTNNLIWQMTLGDKNLVKSNTIKEELINNLGLLNGKTIVNFGDSIFGNTRDNTSVSSFIAQSGANVHNIGFGGCKMSKHSGDWDLCSMYQLAKDIASNDYTDLLNAVEKGWSGMPGYFTNTAKELSKIDFNIVDIITISYGTNDYREGDSISNNVNIFDGDFDEIGFINPSTGEDTESSNYKRTSKYYAIKSVSNLYLNLSELTPSFVVLFYGLNGNYLGYDAHNSSKLKYTLQVPSGAVCFRVYTDKSNNGTNCITYEDVDNAIAYYDFNNVIDSLKYSVRTIQKAYPNIKILITTPIYRSFLNNTNEVITNSDVANFGGGTLEDYSKAYIDTCKELKVPCLDLYHLSQLNKETKSYYYPVDDGTHPNEKGRERIGILIARKIESII